MKTESGQSENKRVGILVGGGPAPGINGTIATEAIRKFNDHTPIIALTAISLDENREMLLSYGMNDVITKPFDPNNFYKVIAQNI